MSYNEAYQNLWTGGVTISPHSWYHQCTRLNTITGQQSGATLIGPDLSRYCALFCYAFKGSLIGAGVSQTIPPIIDSYCAFQPLILFSSTPLRQLFATLSLLNILWEESRTTSIFTSGHLTVVVNGKILHDKIDVFFENSTSTLPKSMKGKLSKWKLLWSSQTILIHLHSRFPDPDEGPRPRLLVPG